MALSDERLPDDILGMLDPAAPGRAHREPPDPELHERLGARVPLRGRGFGRSGTHDLDGLNRHLRRQLHDHDGHRQPLDSVLDRLAA